MSPGLAADMYFKEHVITFIGPACAFALEPVARLADYWNVPIITGMGDQVNQYFKYKHATSRKNPLGDIWVCLLLIKYLNI